ncbi:hypothetical protein, partial [Sphingomonas solaris]|uniref:hypothetical protein n=1 Tax=Alterirhizorhabdus solaris TaxID=2529389 RepID=UPI001939D531
MAIVDDVEQAVAGIAAGRDDDAARAGTARILKQLVEDVGGRAVEQTTDLGDGLGRDAGGDGGGGQSLLNISQPPRHLRISYAGFCLKKKKQKSTIA